ncbi:copper chaperone NosL [Robiginitalea myxolifaciens]|uniref:Copper chaperone NosL n=1 Tax=Robiginitalea myxolifaciens TaxID=400055 RepID=A0A1I6FYK6_9FLAO|nr:nitrous oxide reductase accessory protein NosL [Robiginitalea myxolifaciens]SFR34917.1 copper chaperone NosL [Robiginitalea myxolifaciens]
MRLHGFYTLLAGLGTLLLFSCNAGPEPINYATDACKFCRMVIIDKQHGAEIVTAKGRIYKFDAVECMLNFSADIKDTTGIEFLVNEYIVPGVLRDAPLATYLISEGIPSPMGENLTAFTSRADAENARRKFGGQLYTWTEIQAHFKR